MANAGMETTASIPAVAPRHHLKEITGARFLAAAAVFVLHISWARGTPPWLDDFISQGRAGVCFFFVLSGFILMYTYRHRLKRGGVKSFFCARFARIYPIYFVTLCVALPVSLCTIRYNSNFADWVGSATLTPLNGAVSWLASATMLQIYLPSPHFDFLWNTPCWSIACETIFYLTFPLTVGVIVGTLKSRASILLTIGGLTILQWAAFAAALYWLKFYFPRDYFYYMQEVVYKVPLFRLWEFWIGCCLGLLFTDFKPGRLEERLWRDRGLGVGFFLVLLIVIATRLHVPGTFYLHWFVLYTLPFALIILCLASGPTFLSKWLGSNTAVLLGEASYSFYLLHFMFLEILTCITPHASIPAVAITFVACAATSIFCLKFIEIPARVWVRGLLLPGNAVEDRPVEVTDLLANAGRS